MEQDYQQAQSRIITLATFKKKSTSKIEIAQLTKQLHPLLIKQKTAQARIEQVYNNILLCEDSLDQLENAQNTKEVVGAIQLVNRTVKNTRGIKLKDVDEAMASVQEARELNDALNDTLGYSHIVPVDELLREIDDMVQLDEEASQELENESMVEEVTRHEKKSLLYNDFAIAN
jgi:hypothetical protein